LKRGQDGKKSPTMSRKALDPALVADASKNSCETGAGKIIPPQQLVLSDPLGKHPVESVSGDLKINLFVILGRRSLDSPGRHLVGDCGYKSATAAGFDDASVLEEA
jgi:hypothetical protein